MPPSPDKKIAVLTGSSDEFFRWKTTTQSGDWIHRVVDGENFTQPMFVSVLCLLRWRDGYRYPDDQLRVVRAALIGSTVAAVPPPALDIADVNMVTARVFSAEDRTPGEVLRAWGVTTDLANYVPHDCINALVSMIRVADRYRPSPSIYISFIGFFLQLLAHRFSALNRVAQVPVRMPVLSPQFPTELLELFPRRLIAEELRPYLIGETTIENVDTLEGARLVMKIYRIRELETTSDNGIMLSTFRQRLDEDISRLRMALEPRPHGRIFRWSPSQPISEEEQRDGWHAVPGPPPPERESIDPPRAFPNGLPRLSDPMPLTISAEDADQMRARTEPPPVERQRPRDAPAYVPGQLSRRMARMAEEENERARPQEGPLRTRRRPPNPNF